MDCIPSQERNWQYDMNEAQEAIGDNHREALSRQARLSAVARQAYIADPTGIIDEDSKSEHQRFSSPITFLTHPLLALRQFSGRWLSRRLPLRFDGLRHRSAKACQFSLRLHVFCLRFTRWLQSICLTHSTPLRCSSTSRQLLDLRCTIFASRPGFTGYTVPCVRY